MWFFVLICFGDEVGVGVSVGVGVGVGCGKSRGGSLKLILIFW